MVAPTLTDLTYQYTDTGIVLNSDVTLPFLDLQKVSGLDQAPLRITTRSREGIDGAFIDAQFEEGRTIVLEGIAYASTNAIEQFMDILKGNFQPTANDQPFYFKFPGLPQRVVFGKPGAVSYDYDQARRIGACNVQIQVLCQDPRIYDSDLTTITLQLPAGTTNGRGYNRQYPLTYGGIATSGVVTINNNGNRPAPATLTINGPVTNPIIVNDTLGVTLQFSIDIATGDTLVIDLLNRTIMLNGTANRRNAMLPGSRWFLLQIGANQLRYQAATITTSNLVVAYRSTWR